MDPDSSLKKFCNDNNLECETNYYEKDNLFCFKYSINSDELAVTKKKKTREEAINAAAKELLNLLPYSSLLSEKNDISLDNDANHEALVFLNHMAGIYKTKEPQFTVECFDGSLGKYFSAEISFMGFTNKDEGTSKKLAKQRAAKGIIEKLQSLSKFEILRHLFNSHISPVGISFQNENQMKETHDFYLQISKEKDIIKDLGEFNVLYESRNGKIKFQQLAEHLKFEIKTKTIKISLSSGKYQTSVLFSNNTKVISSGMTEADSMERAFCAAILYLQIMMD